MSTLTDAVKLPVFTPQLVTPTVQNFVCYEIAIPDPFQRVEPRRSQKTFAITEPNINRQAADAPKGAYAMRYTSHASIRFADSNGNNYSASSGEAYVSGCYFLGGDIFERPVLLERPDYYMDAIKDMDEAGADLSIRLNYGEYFMPFRPTDALVKKKGPTYRVVIEPRLRMNLAKSKNGSSPN